MKGIQMITVNDVSMNFSGQPLFKHVDLKFVPGNCYGIIGANGAGKSTFLRILSGDLEPTTGEVIIPKEERMSILKQDHFQYDAYTVLDTVMMGNQHLYDVMKEKDALYEKEDFTDEDGVKASELEAEFAEMGGWEAESDVSRLIQGLGLSNEILYNEMSTLSAKEKVKVLLAQALVGKPDIILLDEPTNHLDITSKEILETAINNYTGTVLYVSHDRYFINKTATRILDLPHEQILSYDGDYNYYLEKKDTVESIHIQEDTATPVSSGKAETSSKTDWKAQKELEAKKRKVENAARQAEETIAALEQDMENIDEEIALPENATNVGRLTELSREKEEKEAALTETMEQWEQLMEQLESF